MRQLTSRGTAFCAALALLSTTATAQSDACAGATAVNSGDSITATLPGTAADGSSTCDPAGTDVWFSFTATAAGQLGVDTLGSTFDTALSVHSACPGNSGNELVCDSNGLGLLSQLSTNLTAGQTVRIRLSDESSTSSTGLYTINFDFVIFPPANDDCANATVINGVGMFAWDNNAATTDGVEDSLCRNFSVSNIFSDVWYSWDAPTSDLYTISTVGLSGAFDTRIAVYDDCSNPESLACNDDALTGGLESEVVFRATQGTTYLFRIGSFSTTAQSSGMFDVSAGATYLPQITTTLMNPGNGNTYHLLEAADWPTSQIAAEELGGNLATVEDQAEMDFIYDNFFNWNGVEGTDIWLGYSDRASEGNFVWASGSTSTYTNWNAGEPNDFAPGEDFVHMQKNFTLGGWNDVFGSSPNGTFHGNIQGLVEIGDGTSASGLCNGDGGDQMGCTNCPCGNNAAPGTVGGCINSAATAARLFRSGSSSVAAGDVRFEMDGGVPASFAVLTSGNAVAPQNAANPCFGTDNGVQSSVLDGLRCAVQSTQRHGGRPVGADGTVGMGLTNGWGPPNGPLNGMGGIPAQGGFTSGQTRVFQVFYRELPGMICLTEQNTSQAERVVFTP